MESILFLLAISKHLIAGSDISLLFYMVHGYKITISAKGLLSLVFCRKREIDCSCLTCTSASFEENAVKIVEVKTGYVSLVTKLQAVDSVQCVVVCDPQYLVAVVKGGNLIVWTMNSTWR